MTIVYWLTRQDGSDRGGGSRTGKIGYQCGWIGIRAGFFQGEPVWTWKGEGRDRDTEGGGEGQGHNWINSVARYTDMLCRYQCWGS